MENVTNKDEVSKSELIEPLDRKGLAIDERFANPKNLKLDGVDWTSDRINKAINNEVIEGIECAIENIAKQAHMNAHCDGNFALLLKPVDMCEERENFISVEFDSDNIVMKFNIIDALESEVAWWIEDGRDSGANEWPDRRKELLELAAKISGLADRLV